LFYFEVDDDGCYDVVNNFYRISYDVVTEFWGWFIIYF